MEIKTIGIIGYGDFGRFLFDLAKERLPRCVTKVYSTSHEADGEIFFTLEEVCEADLLFVCVPIAAFAEVIEKIAPLLGEHTVVCDVATVKTHTVEVLKANRIPRYIATHPMFGPYSYAKQGKSLQGLRIALCDSTLAPAELAAAKAILMGAGLKVLEITAEVHDRLIAETLFVTHLVGQTVTRGGFTRTEIDTVSFGFLMDAVESVAHDEALFKDVYRYNPYCKEVLARYEKAEREVTGSILAP